MPPDSQPLSDQDGMTASGQAALKLRAALAGYNAQYGVVPIGEQHDLPSGASSRVEAVVRASHAALAELERARTLLVAASLHYPQIGPVRDWAGKGLNRTASDEEAR